ncbi:hypothetical protein QYE76_064638 [Lolium multiflorum]|uniref:Uncharacterized protein n=1 Tax=Lolium multiflorum TaxID=4521 RepID=A0AAD8W842_LOLMU|nr:hypothetical protein QYE76_064638 [Lolium multiflorum]
MVFLSATMSNATEFAEWICNLHKQPCHVVYTDFRPTPLQHYVFPIGGSGLYLVVDENGQFREDNFLKLQDTFAKQPSQLDGRKGGGPKASGRIAKGGNASGTSDIYRIVKMIMERKFQPVIIFSFSRRECEHHAMSMSKLDFNTEEEKDNTEQVFRSAILCLSEEDRGLPAIELMLPLLKRGIAVHHSGLLPIIKELVELLFQEGLVKALFATETSAMGLNMPAKTVVFTSVKKWDGDSNRYIGSGEYIQMSGRAGRRGKDERGICVIMIDEKMEMSVIKDMVLGKPAPLISTSRLSYYTILNLLSRAEGQFTAEHVIRNSFHQFQYEKALPEVVQKITSLENEASLLDSSGVNDLAEYHKLVLDISELEKKIMSEMIRSERALLYLVPGRLVKVRDGSTDWGCGVVVNVVKKPAASANLPPALSASRGNNYIVDTLLHCSSSSNENGSRSKPCPPRPGEKGEMPVVPVPLPLVSGLSSVRINIPSDLRPPEARQNILSAVQELGKRYPQGLPKMHPIADMGIEEPELVGVVHKLEVLEQKLGSHPLHKLKGRAACLIDTGDELLITELMFNGTFNDLDHHQVASIVSCFVPCEKSSEQIRLRNELSKPMTQLQEAARKIAEVQRECKLDVNVEEYVERSIIRLVRRLDEFLDQLKAAAEAVGEVNLENKFGSASESLRRGIMFANSLYL